MNSLHALILGILQGLTEFLPVSSSGHLVIFQSTIPNFSQPGIFFDVFVHLGTLLAVFIFFWKKIVKIQKEYLLHIAVASLPAVIVGLLFSRQIESLFLNVKIVGVALIITGVLNFFTDKIQIKKENTIGLSNAFVIGLFQAFAIIPGISRSGSTIFAGVWRKIDKAKAAQFSFLLSLPAVFGASLLETIKYYDAFTFNYSFYLIGFVSALFSGYFALSMVFKIIKKGKFEYFAYYCFIVGLTTLLFV